MKLNQLDLGSPEPKTMQVTRYNNSKGSTSKQSPRKDMYERSVEERVSVTNGETVSQSDGKGAQSSSSPECLCLDSADSWSESLDIGAFYSKKYRLHLWKKKRLHNLNFKLSEMAELDDETDTIFTFDSGDGSNDNLGAPLQENDAGCFVFVYIL